MIKKSFNGKSQFHVNLMSLQMLVIMPTIIKYEVKIYGHSAPGFTSHCESIGYKLSLMNTDYSCNGEGE